MQSRKPILKPRVPEGLRLYVVGDVHGRADLLDQTLGKIDAYLANQPSQECIGVFLGDYIDRGPQSRQVVSRLIERSKKSRIICLKGNHETFVAKFLHDPDSLDVWRHFGGLATLVSYGLKPGRNPDGIERVALSVAFAKALPKAHKKFYDNLESSFLCGDFFFAHAGIRPGVPLERQSDEDLLWIREEFLLSEEQFEKIVVHGHTPVRNAEIRSNRINIDTGAYATGRLTCLVIEGDQLTFL